jgi:ATP-dependent helicase Lhr and Lhr-like helicase
VRDLYSSGARFEAGYVGAVCPPPLPLHLVAQQSLALCLQEGVGRHLWREWSGEPSVLGSRGTGGRALAEAVVDHLVEAELLGCDQGLLSVGLLGTTTGPVPAIGVA